MSEAHLLEHRWGDGEIRENYSFVKINGKVVLDAGKRIEAVPTKVEKKATVGGGWCSIYSSAY
ncbi:MAG: hypothetical protein F6K36_15525 [Symploca sp. SIO3C6]|uniref:Uncharacterized protein n=1 Tax=Symploca sp. SIO1C4 TaxID=2607765 RepID=A0A6B3NAX6_9CYAN|nr:hypothetical protein [Symploca sp. SIO3C6]NER28817.1 hypothetical protein [Symploca sp. SIO1C4]NET04559.1 hypothetical protein [Symploca sp. SIO2B6]